MTSPPPDIRAPSVRILINLSSVISPNLRVMVFADAVRVSASMVLPAVLVKVLALAGMAKRTQRVRKAGDS